MPFQLAEQMKALVDAVRTTARDRASALADVRAQTAKCLSDARNDLRQFAETQREKVAALKQALATDTADRRSGVRRELDAFRQGRQQLRARLAEFLSAARSARRSTVGELLKTAGRGRAELAADLAEASATWFGLAARPRAPEKK